MSVLQRYAIAPELVNLFFDQNEVFLVNLAKLDPEAYEDFAEAWVKWIEDPGNDRFNSHAVDGDHGERGWILWRSKMNRKVLRLFFMVHKRKERLFPVTLRNDHNYDKHVMAKTARRGVGMVSRGEEMHRQRILDQVRSNIVSCLELVE